MNHLLPFILVVGLMIIPKVTEACLGGGCVHDRDRDQFFWCSGRAREEINNIKEWFGGLNRASYESYCTAISAMLVTRDQGLRNVAERLCGTGHEVICHEDISGRARK